MDNFESSTPNRPTSSIALRNWGIGLLIAGVVGYGGGTIAVEAYSAHISSNFSTAITAMYDGSMQTIAAFGTVATISFYVGLIGLVLLVVSYFVGQHQNPAPKNEPSGAPAESQSNLPPSTVSWQANQLVDGNAGLLKSASNLIEMIIPIAIVTAIVVGLLVALLS